MSNILIDEVSYSQKKAWDYLKVIQEVNSGYFSEIWQKGYFSFMKQQLTNPPAIESLVLPYWKVAAIMVNLLIESSFIDYPGVFLM